MTWKFLLSFIMNFQIFVLSDKSLEKLSMKRFDSSLWPSLPAQQQCLEAGCF